MKKLLTIIMALFLISAAFAAAKQDVPKEDKKPTCQELGYDFEKEGSVGSPDTECREAGYDFAVAKWEWTGDTYWKVYEKTGYTTDVSGCVEFATWVSSKSVAGVLSKEGQCYQEMEGGLTKGYGNIEYGISHVTLCGNDDPGDEVPEFTVIGAGLALAGAGFVIARRRRD